jgi:hypothetical protein
MLFALVVFIAVWRALRKLCIVVLIQEGARLTTTNHDQLLLGLRELEHKESASLELVDQRLDQLLLLRV